MGGTCSGCRATDAEHYVPAPRREGADGRTGRIGARKGAIGAAWRWERGRCRPEEHSGTSSECGLRSGRFFRRSDSCPVLFLMGDFRLNSGSCRGGNTSCRSIADLQDAVWYNKNNTTRTRTTQQQFYEHTRNSKTMTMTMLQYT